MFRWWYQGDVVKEKARSFFFSYASAAPTTSSFPYYCYERERAAEPPCTTSIVVLFKAENCKKAIEPYLSPQRLQVRGRRGLFLVLLSPHCLDKKATLPPTFKRYLHKIPFYRTLVKLKRHRPEWKKMSQPLLSFTRAKIAFSALLSRNILLLVL